MNKLSVGKLLAGIAALAIAFSAGAYYQAGQKAHSAANLAALAMQDESAWWSHFVGSLYRAGELVEEYTEELPELDRLEGYRLVTRMTALGFDRLMETANPAAPQFFRLQSATRKFAGDAPDQLYHAANLSGDYSYRITGQLRNEAVSTLLLEASVYGGDMSFEGESTRRLISHIDESELVTDAEGRFEIILSKNRQGENWLKLEDDAKNVLVRRYYKEPQLHDLLPLTIGRLDGEVDTAPLRREQLVKGLLGAAAFAEETTRYWHTWVKETRESLGVNNMVSLQDEGDLLTPAGIKYTQGAWQLEPDQALKITFMPPDVPYWSFVPMNMWMESFDWQVARVTSNKFMATPNADGTITLVLSEQDPQHANWVYTQGPTLEELSTWDLFSKGTFKAIDQVFAELITPETKTSIFIFGDELTGGQGKTFNEYRDEFSQNDINVPIHTKMFSTQFLNPPEFRSTGRRFAVIFFEVAEKTGGTFELIEIILPD